MKFKMMEFNYQLPINSSSYSQMSVGVMLEMFERGLTPNIFPIGGKWDFGAYDLPKDFEIWFEYCIRKSNSKYKRSIPTLKVWHISESIERISDYQVLWTAHEVDSLTKSEINICNNIDKVLVVSNFNKEVFNKYGVAAETCHNFFDSRHFKRIEVPKKDDVLSWNLTGKFEGRKRTVEIIAAWIKL